MNMTTRIKSRMDEIANQHNKLAEELTQINASKTDHESKMMELRGAHTQLAQLLSEIESDDQGEDNNASTTEGV